VRIIETLRFIAATLAFGSGCQSKPAPQQEPAPVVEGDGSTITLPKRSGKPPVKTAKPLEAPGDFDQLAALAFPGFKADVQERRSSFLVRHQIDVRPKLAVKVGIRKCSAGDCPVLEAKNWPRAKLIQDMRAPLRDAPDLVVDVETTTVDGGATAVAIYKLGYLNGNDATGAVTQYVHSYTLLYNDGVNQLEVVTLYTDDDLGSKAAIVDVVPRDHLERIGKAFFDAYAQAW
jgi:hypothetical protein